MTKQEYNGWYNHETWNFALWFNPDDFQDEMESIVENYEAPTISFLSSEDRQVNQFSDFLKAWFEDYLEETLVSLSECGIAADLLNAAVSEINFDDISRSWMGTFLETLATAEEA